MSSVANCGLILQEKFGDSGDDADFQILEKTRHLFYEVYDNIDLSSAVQSEFCSMSSSCFLAGGAGSAVRPADLLIPTSPIGYGTV